MNEAAMKYYQPQQRPNPTTQRFIFATGIECSYPTIQTAQGVVRQDELEKCRHYEYWREDLQLTVDLGIRFLRYGTPYYRVHTAPGKYDWAFTDEVLAEMRRLGVVPIIDLCHFGVPDWIENFQNPEFCLHFRDTRARSASVTRGCGSTRRSTRCTSRRSFRRSTAGGTSGSGPIKRSSRR